MKSVDIFEKSWLDLVFEGKNKSYGAYQLRQESTKTTLAALFYGLLLIVGIAGIMTLSSFMNPPATAIPPISTPIVPVRLQPKVVEPIQPKAQPIKQPESPNKKLPPVVVPTAQADPDPIDTPVTPTNTTAPTTGITGPATTIPTTSGGGVAPATIIPTSPVLATSLDVLPQFPGGITKFYTYVGNNFGKTDIGDEKTIRIYVSFTIEKDGSMTDIRVPRDPGFGLGNEAIRVLKSLKTKWSPGQIAGQAVRTAYSLPITVKTE